VKVAVRCRPAFQDEIEFANNEFFSIVDMKREPAIVQQQQQPLGQLSLTTISGKQRDFYFDHCFGDEVTQDVVYDRLARPIVSEVLQGCNGTIFAYGQTGTGKVRFSSPLSHYFEYVTTSHCS
jgi:kinesin family member 11